MDGYKDLPAQMKFIWAAEEDAAETHPAAALAKKKSAGLRIMKKKSVKTSRKKTRPSKASAKAASTTSKAPKKAAQKKVGAKAKIETRKPVASKKKATRKKGQKRASTPTTETQAAIKNVSAESAVNLGEKVECFDLKWGSRFPKIGFGFWKVPQEQTSEVCRSAIESGYRHLDCACDYGNEVEVGQGIQQAIDGGLCEREDLWITSKLWNTYHEPTRVQQACEKTLTDLGVDYLDLYLIHFPLAQRFVPFEKRYPPGWFFDPNTANPVVEEARVPLHETWQAMEQLAKSGLVRNIGICNVGTAQLRDLLCYASIRPSVLQVESHPYLTQEKLLRYCQQERIVYTAFSPLGAQSYFSLGMAEPSEAVMEHKVIKTISAETTKTPAQILLRWGIQRGTAVIPKTSSRDRMLENLAVFDFELTEKQMQAISALDKGRRFNDPGHFGEAAFNTFLPIYE